MTSILGKRTEKQNRTKNNPNKMRVVADRMVAETTEAGKLKFTKKKMVPVPIFNNRDDAAARALSMPNSGGDDDDDL